MKLSPYLLGGLATLASVTFATADSAQEIVEKFDAQKFAALQQYLKDNPAADDRVAALDHLVEAAQSLGKSDLVGGFLREKFALLPTGADADLRTLAMTIQGVLEAYKNSGDKEAALKFLEEAKGAVKGNSEEQAFVRYIDQLGGTLNQPGIGDVMDISFTSLEGDKIDLSKMKGKVVLVDFWATWCGPCKAELPHVKETYEKFHGKGFEIVAISLDQDEAKLKSFIEKEEMPWPQFFDGKGWQNEISTKFGIQSIPATFLVGKEGKVIEMNLRGDALGKAVAAELGL